MGKNRDNLHPNEKDVNVLVEQGLPYPRKTAWLNCRGLSYYTTCPILSRSRSSE